MLPGAIKFPCFPRRNATAGPPLRALILNVEKGTPQDLNDRELLRSDLVDILGRMGATTDAGLVEKWLREDVQRLNNNAAHQQEEIQRWETRAVGGRPPSHHHRTHRLGKGTRCAASIPARCPG
jgi:hypothetical protein